jgi:four helix bundle protein
MPRYSNLLVWNHARKIVQEVTSATRGVRGEGDLISQIRRASLSVAANIAEGAERGSDRDFVRFLKIANGSNAETQALTLIADDAGIFSAQQVTEIVNHTNQIGRMLNSLMYRCSG